jgi:hypothetical protein
MGQSFVNECNPHPSPEEFSACLDETTALLDKCGVDYSLADGTLLGQYRDGAPLRWDRTVDLYHRQADREQLRQCLIQAKVPFAASFLDSQLQFCCPSNGVQVDMTGVVPSLSNKYSCALDQSNEFETSDLLPFADQLPADPEAVLNARYGKNAWKTATDDGHPGAGCWRIGF